jgi:hypothetical protein
VFDNLELFTGVNMDEAEKDELDRYLVDDVIKVNDPIKWWLAKSSLFPSLSRMALDYLSIPGE